MNSWQAGIAIPAMHSNLFEDQTVESPVAQQEQRQRNNKLFQELFIHVVLCSRRFLHYAVASQFGNTRLIITQCSQYIICMFTQRRSQPFGLTRRGRQLGRDGR